MYEAFNYSPDRAATTSDQYPNWPYLYAVDWDGATKGGDVYLRSIFYTPANGIFSLNAEGETAQLITPDQPTFAGTQLLSGISAMSYNNASSAVQTLQDVFDLVSQGTVCVSDSGAKARFFWNPAALYTQSGNGESISQRTNALVAGVTCIGN